MTDSQQRQRDFEESVGRYLALKQRGWRDDDFRISVLAFHLSAAIEDANLELEDIGLEPYDDPCDACFSLAVDVLLQCGKLKDRAP